MIDCDEVKRMIAQGLACQEVLVESDGKHYEAIVISAEFEGKSRVKRQQMINAILKTHFDSGELHALSMRTLTPAELDALRG